MSIEKLVKVCVILLVALGTLYKTSKVYRIVRRFGFAKTVKVLVSRFILLLPKYRAELEIADKKFKRAFYVQFMKKRTNPTKVLPYSRTPSTKILQQIQDWSERDKQFQSRTSGALYHDGKELNDLAHSLIKPFIISNSLHPGVFPATRQMESEIVQITLNLFHAPSEACGVLTFGGSESCLMAMLAYREWGRSRGITDPEIVAPTTAHVIYDKAAHYFGMTLVKVPVGPDSLVDLRAFEREINRNTVAIIGSAPSYPSGIIDQLEDFGALALRYGTNFHIDACLGGYLIPFMEKAGYPIPVSDFRVKGVTTISCDPHKYGYTPKGVSVIMYKSSELRRLQYFGMPKWPGGVYLSPGIAGSRSGVNSAAAWGILQNFGKNGYVDCTQKIMKAATYIKEHAKEIPELELLGNPIMSIVAFTSTVLNVHVVADEMKKSSGWSISHLQNPRAIHIAVTMTTYHLAEEFISDLKQAVHVVKESKDETKYQMAALYGVGAQVPDSKVFGKFLHHYVDMLYTA